MGNKDFTKSQRRQRGNQSPETRARRIIKEFSITMLPETERDLRSFIEAEIYEAIKSTANYPPECARCGDSMEAQEYKSKITWWVCASCSHDEDSEPPKF